MPIIKIKEITPCEKELLIEVSDDLFKAELAMVYQKIGEEEKFPGFRKGVVPINVIKSKYGLKAEENAVNRVIPKAYEKAVQELNLTPVVDPIIENIEVTKKKPIRFSATFEHLPVIKLKCLKGFNFKWEIIKVTDEDVLEELENIRESCADWKNVTGRISAEGDFVTIDFDGSIDGVPFKGGKGKGVKLCIGGARFLRDFEQGIIGMSLGEKKDLKVVFPEDYPGKNLAGKKAVFKIALKEIKEKKLLELNDRFAKERCNEKNLKALKASVKKNVEEKEEERGKLELKDKIFLKLHEANPFEFPDTIVEAQARMMAYHGFIKLGFSEEMIKKEQERLAKFKEANLPAARTCVITHLISEKIREMEKMAVTEEELMEGLKKQLATHGIPGEGGFGREENPADTIKEKILDDKVFDYLMSQNQVDKVYIDRPENNSENENS